MTNGRGGSACAFPPGSGPGSDGHDSGKSLARRQAKAHRAAIPAVDRQRYSIGLAERALLALDFSPSAIVAGYAAIRDEADPAPLLEHLHQAGAVCALPAVEAPAKPLTFRRWQPGDRLEAGSFGVPEPLAAAPTLRPEIILVPLLAFDRQGGRVGYGAGYYDRTLAALRRDGPVLAIGLAFSVQEVPAVPLDPFDQSLDWVITELEAIRCPAPANAAPTNPAPTRADGVREAAACG